MCKDGGYFCVNFLLNHCCVIWAVGASISKPKRKSLTLFEAQRTTISSIFLILWICGAVHGNLSFGFLYSLLSLSVSYTASIIFPEAWIQGDLGSHIWGTGSPRKNSDPTFGPDWSLKWYCEVLIALEALTEVTLGWGIKSSDAGGPFDVMTSFHFCMT